MKYLITGAKGQLAREFISKFSEKNQDFFALSKEELDIRNTDKVFEVIRLIKPDVIINCAAYNLVDKAESAPTDAIAVNTFGVANLIFACAETKTFLIHYSTDYVFDGTKQGLYTEEDKPNPISEYGKSKLFGEYFIQETLDKYLIFRTSWVYGKGTQNFIYKLTQWAKDRDVLQIAFNEVSVPTYTGFIVEKTLKALDRGLNGLYHLVPRGYTSRYEWAKLALKLFGINKVLIPVQKEIFNLPAKRPDFSAMSSDRIERELGDEFKEWDGIYSRVYKTLGGLT